MIPFRSCLVAVYLVAAWMLASLALLIGSPSPLVISVLAFAIFFWLLRTPRRYDVAPFTLKELRIVYLLASVAAVFALIVHRPDGDDGGYLNLSVYFAKHFFDPLPQHWTIFPNHDAPLPYPLFRFSAFYFLVGFLSVPFEPLDIVAFLIVPACSALCVFANALLFKTCFPKSWVIGLLCYLLFLAIDASSPALPSQFSFVRIWQGKSLLLNVGIPFFTYLLVRPATTQAKDFFLVGAAFMGLSPMASLFIAATTASTLDLKKVRAGITASIIPVALTLSNAKDQFDSVDKSFAAPRLSEIALWFFGSETTMLFWIAIFVIALTCGTQKRLILGSLVTVTMMFNPLSAEFVARYITSSLVFWRILWLCPFALALGSIVDLLLNRGKWWAASIIPLIIALPTKYSWENSNYAELRLPSRKVPLAAQAAVEMIHARVPEGCTIIAPHEVSAVLLSSKKEIYSLTPRVWYVFRVFDQGLGRKDEYKDREYALLALEGMTEFNATRMNRIISHYDIRAVVVPLKSKNARDLNSLFDSQHFESVTIKEKALAGPYMIWFRNESPLNTSMPSQ